LGKKIGEGAFGIVYCAQTTSNDSNKDIKNQTVAVKVLKGKIIKSTRKTKYFIN
jgi:serine/threonine protein kinase